MWGLPMLEKKAKAKAICESNKIDELEKLIADFKSNSTDTRSDAKLISESCIDGPNGAVFAKKLCDVLSSPLDPDSHTISAILLRKSLINKYDPHDSPFLRFPPETQSTLKRDLLKLVDPPAGPINKELCHTVSALAVSLLPKKEWPEFLPFLFELVESHKKRALALLIVACLAQYLGKELNKLHSVNSIKDKNLYKKLYSILLECLTDLPSFLLKCLTTEGDDVRIAALGAAINFILCLEQTDLVNFQDLLTAMMSTLKKALYSGNETMAAVNTLKLLINLAGMKPTFLRKQIVEMVKTILLMADDDSLEKETRRLAIEFVLTLVPFVLTLAEVEKTNPGLLKLGREFEINMEEMWDDNKETHDYGCWQECVERLSNLSNRWDGILTVALEVFPAYLAAPKEQKPHAAVIALSKSIIKWNCRECLKKEEEWDVRVEALGAAINFIQCPDLLTSMLSMLEKVLEDRDEAMASEVLELLIKLVEPRILVGQIEEWVKRMWQIANNDSLNVGTRRLAVEFLLELAQVEEIAPWLRNNVGKLFEILMNMLDYINDDDPNADYVSAWEINRWRWRNCLNMLLVAVGGNDMFSLIWEVLPDYLYAPEWQKKCSAVIVLTESMKSCRQTQMTIEDLEQVVAMVLGSFPNDHHHVQCAAIEAIQQLAKHLLHFHLHEEVMRTNFELVMSKLLSSFQDDDPVVQNASICAMLELTLTFGEHLQVVCHLVLPVLAEVMDDSPNQDMRVRAASAILVFSEYCTPENLREHLDGSITSCLIVSKEVKKFVTRIGFTEWEMPSRHDMHPWHIRLSEEGHDSWKERLSKAWEELWRDEERDFSPYLEILMFPVFSAAQLDLDVARHDVVILKKAMACQVLCFCVDELGELFVPEIDRVVDTLIPFLKWYHEPPAADARYCSKAIRIAAASALPGILYSARAVVESSDPTDYDHKKQHFEMLSDKVKRALEETSDVIPNSARSVVECSTEGLCRNKPRVEELSVNVIPPLKEASDVREKDRGEEEEESVRDSRSGSSGGRDSRSGSSGVRDLDLRSSGVRDLDLRSSGVRELDPEKTKKRRCCVRGLICGVMCCCSRD